ncbi:hypothetical protein CEXT_351311 [Caerostris extrusa]|uniref:Uncharacterized protein n=1 Tax=Caerostris extrusa TaxID=172846 RepID=A0AAV4VGP6_CAEEX|nr:hypothetical protein CEXT_351311 [Caerostris extrusa]
MVSVFQVNTSFYITLSGNTVLPKEFLSGLSVTELTVDDFQTQRGWKKVLSMGCSGSDGFSVRRSSIKFVIYFSNNPETNKMFSTEGDFDFRAIRSSLWYLRLANSRLTQLRGDHLKNLTSLYELFLQQFHLPRGGKRFPVCSGPERPEGGASLLQQAAARGPPLCWNEPRGQLNFYEHSLE